MHLLKKKDVFKNVIPNYSLVIYFFKRNLVRLPIFCNLLLPNPGSFSFSPANTLVLTRPSLCILKKIFLWDGWIICSAFAREGLVSFIFLYFIVSFRHSLVLMFWSSVCVWALPTAKLKSYRCLRNSIKACRNIIICIMFLFNVQCTDFFVFYLHAVVFL